MTKKTTTKKKAPNKLPTVKRNTKSREQLEKEILKFLYEASAKRAQGKPGTPVDNGLGCVLATSKNNVPRATPVDFCNDGFTIWIIGDPGKKILNIRSNPRVGVGVYHPMDRTKLNRSLQIQGKAKLINYKEHRKIFLSAVKKIGVLSTIEYMADLRIKSGALTSDQKEAFVEKILCRFNLIRINPDEITYLNIHPKKGMSKDIWKKRGR